MPYRASRLSPLTAVVASGYYITITPMIWHRFFHFALLQLLTDRCCGVAGGGDGGGGDGGGGCGSGNNNYYLF